ncbi:hypothetical protein EVAR_38386_1 [Eumeta japonica]|uniref:Uncharacterized protein n=1 Tax=Eumeta variegata TaxID=151549 RepID=A0A4C1YJ80_EUMVA|nr:hypothetical protein EVAR_38386_1 [Eumeta japonica]
MCKNEYKYASQIAKRKCGDSISWAQLYKNLSSWPKIIGCEKNVKKFYNFTKHDNRHALDIDDGILAMKETNGTVLYDINTLKYIPIALPQKNCYKLSNNNYVTAVLTERGLFVQRSVENKSFVTELLLEVDQFILLENILYYNKQKDVYKCDMNSKDMMPKLLFTCEYNICGLQYSDDLVHLFTDCGEIFSYREDKKISRKMINCPEEWIKRKHATKPIFEQLAVLPDEKIAVTLDVYEKKTGPVIVASTFLEVFLIEVEFFPEERGNAHKKQKPNNILLFKRLLRLKERMRSTN